MKFKISQAQLLKTLTTASKSLLVRANLPILSNLLLSITSKGLEITSTNLETATKIAVECKVELEGQTTIAGRSLIEFVSQLPEGEITVEKLGGEAVFSAKGYSARFATMPADEFPAIPQIEKGTTFEIDARELAGAIDRVAFCAAQDEGRPILTGVLCEIAKGKMGVVATDGYRLSFDEVKIISKEGLPSFKIIMPAKALVEVGKIIEEEGGGKEGGQKEQVEKVEVTVSAALNQINFRLGGGKKEVKPVEFISRLIEGEFPNWQKIIPANFVTRAEVSRAELARLVRINSIFARESGNIIKFKLSREAGNGSSKGGATFEVLAQGGQTGSADASCAAQMSGEGGEIAFNFRYVLEILSVLAGEKVNFEMNESLNPGKITTEVPKDPFFHIIMPVRLQA